VGKGAAEATEQRKVLSGGPPTSLQNLNDLAVMIRQGRHVSSNALRFWVNDVFVVAELAEPTMPEEMLSRHMRDAEFVCIDNYLLIAELEFFAVARSVAQCYEAFNEKVQRNFFGHGVRSGAVGKPPRVFVGPSLTIREACSPSYALIAVIRRTAYMPCGSC